MRRQPRQFLQILQTGEPDLCAGTFEDTGPTAKAVSPVIRDRMIDQCLPSLFDIEQRLVGNEPHHFRIGVQLEERLRVIFHIFSQQQAIGLENHFHLNRGGMIAIEVVGYLPLSNSQPLLF